MPVNPIDYGRYGYRDMIAIFEEEYRHRLWLEVEAVVAEIQAELEIIPLDAAEDIRKTAKPNIVTLERTMEIESRTRHDIAALFEAIAEKCEGPGARWVHFGLTSNDVKDTALGLQMKAAFHIITPQIKSLGAALAKQAQSTEEVIAVGRSHGQHAVPITYGIRFSVWLDEIRRHFERFIQNEQRAVVGKIAGATGSHAALGVQGLEMQKRALTRLELAVPVATTQIVQRDRHAETIMVLANLSASIEKIATDLRNLQRTEIGETFEPFAKGKQVGSSAMPHKRNPVSCEKICGIARYVRSLVAPALENVISWEERDITHSSTERFLIPQAFILADYLVREMTRVIEGLEIDNEAVERNLKLSNESILSEYVTTVLTMKGLERPKAHSKLREISTIARETGKGLLETIAEDNELEILLGKDAINVESYFDSIREVSKEIVYLAVAKFSDTTR